MHLRTIVYWFRLLATVYSMGKAGSWNININIKLYTDGLAQDCSISFANASEILQSCTEPSTWCPNELRTFFFTWGQYWSSGIVVACVCVFVCLRVNHLLVRAITRNSFKLGSPNLDRRHWLRSLLFLDWSTMIFKVKFNFKFQIYPILSLSAP